MFDDICGDLDIRIGRDGTWYYHGSPIGRLALVKLFSTVLLKDDEGEYWLVTPVEKGRIEVEDAPFVAVELIVEGAGSSQQLKLRTNVDDIVAVGADHPLWVEHDDETGEPGPYVMVRDGLEAKINRPVFYELVELAEARDGASGDQASGDQASGDEASGDEASGDDEVRLGVWSGGSFFELGSVGSGAA